jgi:hypothetical protein
LENFGYNTYQLYDKAVQSESAINDTFDYYKGCSDQYDPRPDFMNIWDDLPGNMMRFPGGTASQLYHSGFTNYPYTVTPAQSSPYYPDITSCPYSSYASGTASSFRNQNNNKFKGYGVKNKNNVGGERLPNTPDFGSGTSSIWRKLYEDLDPPQKRNIIYDFIELIKAKEAQQGKPIEVLYVFNIVTHLYNHTTANLIENVIENKIYTNTAHTALRPEFVSEMNENLNTLRFLLNNGINVVGVEMGNELTHGRYKEMNLSVNEYLEIVKQYAIQIRTLTEFSGIKIGVLGEVSLSTLPNFNFFSCDSSLNQQGQGILQMSTSYNLCWNFNLSSYNTFIKDNITYPLYDAFVIHKYFGAYQNIYNASVDTSLANFMDGIDKLKTIYLSNPQNDLSNFKIWFTEWNQDAKVIDTIKKSENTRYIFDVYTYLTQYNALNNNVFEYTIFHNFMGDSPISLLNTNSNGTSIIQRDNIKAHYLMNAIQDVVGTTSTKTSIMSVPKSDALKFLDISVGNNKLWLRDYALLSDFNATQGLGKIGVPNPCPPPSSICDCWVDKYHKDIYFLFNNSTSNNYCLNPIFKNTSTQYSLTPDNLDANTLMPKVYYYKEDFSNSTDDNLGFLPTLNVVNNSHIIPSNAIGYVKYGYDFDPNGCYFGSRLSNAAEEDKVSINSIFIYPNPTQNKLFVGGLNTELEHLATIFDVQGKASNYQIENNEIDISNLSNGIYFLSLENEGVMFHRKFVIQK